MVMDMNDSLNAIESRNPQAGAKHPKFEVGDVVDVGVWIVEGDKKRVQTFNGRVIARRGAGLRQTFTVRRIVDNEGVERDFPLHSPLIESVKVKSKGKARRAKLFFLRERVGKQTRLREVIVAAEEAPVAAGAPDSKKGKKRGAKAKAERQARAGEMEAKKEEARKKKRAAKKAEKAGAGEKK